MTRVMKNLIFAAILLSFGSSAVAMNQCAAALDGLKNSSGQNSEQDRISEAEVVQQVSNPKFQLRQFLARSWNGVSVQQLFETNSKETFQDYIQLREAEGGKKAAAALKRDLSQIQSVLNFTGNLRTSAKYNEVVDQMVTSLETGSTQFQIDGLNISQLPLISIYGVLNHGLIDFKKFNGYDAYVLHKTGHLPFYRDFFGGLMRVSGGAKDFIMRSAIVFIPIAIIATPIVKPYLERTQEAASLGFQQTPAAKEILIGTQIEQTMMAISPDMKAQVKGNLTVLLNREVTNAELQTFLRDAVERWTRAQFDNQLSMPAMSVSGKGLVFTLFDSVITRQMRLIEAYENLDQSALKAAQQSVKIQNSTGPAKAAHQRLLDQAIQDRDLVLSQLTTEAALLTNLMAGNSELYNATSISLNGKHEVHLGRLSLELAERSGPEEGLKYWNALYRDYVLSLSTGP